MVSHNFCDSNHNQYGVIMKKYIFVLIIMLVVIAAIGCSSRGSNTNIDNYQSENYTELTQTAEPPALTILDSKLTKDEYGVYFIIGTAKANKDLGYTEVSTKCYGPDGKVIGSYIANINNLKAGEIWNFKVIGPVDDSVRVTKYTIASGNYF